MRKIYLLIIFSAFLFRFVPTTTAQSWVWAEQGVGSGNSNNDEGYSVARDKAGNVYITGSFFDTLIVGTDTLRTRYNTSAFLIKYNSSGQVLWARQSSGNSFVQSEQIGYSVATDKLDNVYLTGRFTDTAYFGSYRVANNHSNSYNAFLVKYDSTGNVSWARQSVDSGNGNALAWSVATDGNNNAYIAGNFYFNITFGSHTLSNRSQHTYFLVKYDPNGNVAWAAAPLAGRGSNIYSIVADAAGNTYVTGTFFDTLELGRDTLLNDSYFVAKYNTNGKPVWGQQGSGRGYSAALDPAENVYTTGYYTQTGNFSNISLPNTGNNPNIFLAKYDSAGKCRWVINSTKPNGSAWEAFSVVADKYSNTYILGAGDGISDIQFGNKTFSLNNAGSPLVLVEFDSSGNALCGSVASDGGDDNCGLAADPEGDYVYLGGDIEDTITFGPDKIGPKAHTDEWPFIAKWQTCNSNTTIAVREVQSESEVVKVYPNPGNGQFTLYCHSERSEESLPIIEVYNVLGEQILTETLRYAQGDNLIDLSKQPNGVYLYRVMDKNSNLLGQGKLVIEK